MANKKVSQLTSKPSVLNTDIIPIADPTSGQLFKTTLSALGAVIGSAVASVNGLVGVVVLDTDDIQELASPTNRWYTDTRSRASISGGTGISYNSGTGVITNAVTSGQIVAGLGYGPANDSEVVKLTGSQTIGGVKTFSSNIVSNGFVKIGGTSGQFLMADGSVSTGFSFTYPSAGIAVSTGSAWGTSIANNSGNWNTAFSWGNHAGLYLPIGGGTLTGNLLLSTGSDKYVQIGSSTSYFWRLKSASNNFQIIGGNDEFTALTFSYPNGEATFNNSVIATSFVKSGGTSSQFLKADGSVDLRSFATTANLDNYLALTGGALANTLSSGYVLTVTNNSTASGANGLNVSIATGSTGMPFKVDKGGVSLFTVDNLGASVLKSTITAISFIRSSGTSSDFLKADGSVDSNTYVSSSALSAYLPLAGGTLTGALGGTSAIFSSSVTATTNLSVLASTNAGGIVKVFTSSSVPTQGSAFILAPFGNAILSHNILFNGSGYVYDQSGFGTSIRLSSGNANPGDIYFNTFTSGTAGASATENNKMIIKQSGNVGIGTNAPSGASGLALAINGGASQTRIALKNSFTGDGAGNGFQVLLDAGSADVALELRETGSMRFATSSIERMRITSAGAVSFGVRTDATEGTANLSLNNSNYSGFHFLDGTAYYIGQNSNFRSLKLYSGSTSNGLTIASSGAATFSSSVTATGFFESSDSRLKTLIKDNYQGKGIESVTAKLYTKNGVTELGYFAQDVQGILPSAVTTGENGFLNLSYREVHTAKIARLEKEVEELKEQLNLI